MSVFHFDSDPRNRDFFKFPKIIIICTISFVLFLTFKTNYILFHTLAEGFSVIVAFSIFIFGSSTYKHSKDNYLLFLSYAYVFIGLFNLLYLMTFNEMNIFTEYTTNTTTQLWIAGRYLEALSLLIAPSFIGKKFSKSVLFSIYGITSTILIVLITVFPLFPDCYIEGQGLTTFKILSEYVISILILGAAINLYRYQTKFNSELFNVIFYSMSFFILAELSLTLYTYTFGFMNFIGHLLKMISYYCIYKGIIIRGLDEPHAIVFRELKQTSTLDYLTGLYNRQGFIELLQIEAGRAKKESHNLGLLLLDLNDFKQVNDNYGHLAGDFVLKGIAKIINSCIRDGDIACRLGGDEFVVILKEADFEIIRLVMNKIKTSVSEWDQKIPANIGVSIGSSIWTPNQELNIDLLVREADASMYIEKGKKVTVA